MPKQPATTGIPVNSSWKKWVVLGIVIIIILSIIGWVVSSYNTLVTLDQGVQSQWSKVEAAYQMRFDKIPNLVNSVRGYMQYESQLLENITMLRSQWMTAATVDDKIQYADSLSNAISRLLMVKESYPDLKADKSVTILMDEISSIENSIKVERMRFADSIQAYNRVVKVFPSNIIAGWFGFIEKTYYEAVPGADTAPVVNLG
ncbi:MAG: LemA family protein [Candidatus Aenigmatarchaeota archaeon]